jgi:hypothetical protein
MGQSSSSALPNVGGGPAGPPRAAAPPIQSISRPPNLMHASKVRPILRAFDQSSPERILANVLPLLRVALAVAHAMMKSARLKFPYLAGRTCWSVRGRAAALPYQMGVGRRCRAAQTFHLLGEAIFPEAHPAFDGELQITRRAEEMQMIGHKEIIADEPRGGGVFPNLVQRALNRSLRQPAPALLRANGQENPIRSAERNVNALRRRATARIAEGRSSMGVVVSDLVSRASLEWGRAAALPYQIW